jgi:hypothetical protein
MNFHVLQMKFIALPQAYLNAVYIAHFLGIQKQGLKQPLFAKVPSGFRIPARLPYPTRRGYKVQSSSLVSFKEEEQSMKNTVVFRTEKGNNLLVLLL